MASHRLAKYIQINCRNLNLSGYLSTLCLQQFCIRSAIITRLFLATYKCNKCKRCIFSFAFATRRRAIHPRKRLCNVTAAPISFARNFSISSCTNLALNIKARIRITFLIANTFLINACALIKPIRNLSVSVLLHKY